MASVVDYIRFLGSVAAVVLIFLVIAKTIGNAPTGYVAVAYSGNTHRGSCENACGGPTYTPGGSCFCDDKCYSKGDCCKDIRQYCK